MYTTVKTKIYTAEEKRVHQRTTQVERQTGRDENRQPDAVAAIESHARGVFVRKSRNECIVCFLRSTTLFTLLYYVANYHLYQ